LGAAGADDEMRERDIVGPVTPIGACRPSLPNGKCHVMIGGADLIEVEGLGVPVRGLPEIRRRIGKRD